MCKPHNPPQPRIPSRWLRCPCVNVWIALITLIARTTLLSLTSRVGGCAARGRHARGTGRPPHNLGDLVQAARRLAVLLRVLFICSSPEFLLKDLFISTIQALTERFLLRLLWIDEVHQIFILECASCPHFEFLKEYLFKIICINNDNASMINESQLSIHLKVPLLLMTETFDTELLNILQSLIAIRVTPPMQLWSGR